MEENELVPGGYDRKGRPARVVKNKNPASIQITAEQILREANERQDQPLAPPRQKITDPDELAEYQLRKRKEHEDAIRRNRTHIGSWLKYAAWEESQIELPRARSIYERALDVDGRNVTLYVKYIEMEMKNRNINSARNLYDRAVTLLPRVDQFWFKYTYMEEMLGNVAGARQIFERWMQWQPDESAWMAYVKFEKRYKELERAREVYERFVNVHPEPKNWIKWAKFEEEHGSPESVRGIFTRAIELLGEFIDQRLFLAFAKFETLHQQYERARVIYKYALERLPKSKAQALYNQYVRFEKQHGDQQHIEDIVVGKRRIQYEDQLKANPHNYDVWFDYVKLEESEGNPQRVRDVYERAIAQVPPDEKRFWRRYIYLWINYAFYEELEQKDAERTRQVYLECLKLIPHKKFTFAKIWLLYAKFEIRQLELGAARKSLGQAIGLCPKAKLFRGYIELEKELREFDRVRKLYEKHLEFNPSDCRAWIGYAETEHLLQDHQRVRAIYELAIQQPVLDMPESLWKAYIDYETSEQQWNRARKLYEQLLLRTDHVQAWSSYARFEYQAEGIEGMRKIYRRAFELLRGRGDERVALLDEWAASEDDEGQEAVEAMRPKLVRRKGANGEVSEFVFADDAPLANTRLLEMAHKWKKQTGGIV